MDIVIIYNWYNERGNLIAEKTYRPKDSADYDRVMGIFEREPDTYEIVNVVPITELK